VEKCEFYCSCIVIVIIVIDHDNGAGRCAAKWCCVMRFLVTERVSSFEIYQLSAVIDKNVYVTNQL
jgi:hypothetical protein